MDSLFSFGFIAFLYSDWVMLSKFYFHNFSGVSVFLYLTCIIIIIISGLNYYYCIFCIYFTTIISVD